MKEYEYLDVVRQVLSEGEIKPSRTGIRTMSTFGVQYEVDVGRAFPLLTTKEVSWKNIVIETLWFLSGSKSVEFLHRHGCRFWDPWAGPDGRVPSAYGHYWRHFPMPNGDEVDQIAYVLRELDSNPSSRRMVVSAWEPGNATTSALPPCHAFFALHTSGVQDILGRPHFDDARLNLHLTQRSCDVALGLPYNLAGYALLLEILSAISGIPPGTFAHSIVDAHVYIGKADGDEYDHRPGLAAQLRRELRPLPALRIDPEIRSLSDIEEILTLPTDQIMSIFTLEGYDPHPPIPFKVAV